MRFYFILDQNNKHRSLEDLKREDLTLYLHGRVITWGGWTAPGVRVGNIELKKWLVF
jgi:hypothetical protein